MLSSHALGSNCFALLCFDSKAAGVVDMRVGRRVSYSELSKTFDHYYSCSGTSELDPSNKGGAGWVSCKVLSVRDVATTGKHSRSEHEQQEEEQEEEERRRRLPSLLPNPLSIIPALVQMTTMTITMMTADERGGI